MGIFRVLSQIVIMAAVISAAGCRCAENLFCAVEAKITRFFSWAAPQNEIQAQKFAQAGVTDIIVGNRKQHELAKKYGMNPYWKLNQTSINHHIAGRLPSRPKQRLRAIYD